MPICMPRFAKRATILSVLATTCVIPQLLIASPASATTLQTTVLAPLDGRVTSAPSEPHHRPYGGDYAFDVAGTGSVYARFRNTNGSLSLSVANIGRACGSGVFAHGGDRITLNVFINGAKVGTVAYAHMTDFNYTSGNVPVGARIGRAVTTGDGVSGSSCWSGAHIHVEPRNDVRYGCYVGGLLGTNVNGGSPLGIVGGERAAGVNVPCSGNFETPPTIGDGTFVRRPDGAVFRMAGGAPLYVSSWNPFGGPQPYVDISWEQYNAMPAYPTSNTFIHGQSTGRVFRVVDEGRRYYVSSWGPYGGGQPTIGVDDFAIDNCDHLRCEPFGAVDLVEGVPGGVRVAGWAMDPDTTAPIDLHVYAGGTMLGAFRADRSRPDVDNVFHRGDRFGYDNRLAVGPGIHRICVYGINVAQGGGNHQIGCQEVAAQPRVASTISVAPSKRKIVKGRQVTLSGSVSAGSPVPGAGVHLYRWHTTREAWVRMTSAQTSPSGQYVIQLRPRKTRTYLVAFDGDFGRAPATATTRVKVKKR